MMIEDPLQCRIDKDKIVITIGFDALKFLAEESNNCEKYDKDFCPDGIWSKVINKKLFAQEILRSLKQEEEDGTTIVHTLFEDAINMALENGAEGVKLK
jgi:hypothetical protein